MSQKIKMQDVKLVNGSRTSDFYKIGIYVRESRDDNEENYDTIETQRNLLIDFVKKNGLGEVYKVYEDDNVSGSIFDRKGIDLLKGDIISGNINLLIIKDLSRLGRNNARTLLFLDFLEEYGVRVITFDGRYDSLKDNDTVGIDTWFNERYIRDISRKIRANLRFKIEKGEYIGHAPYGYIKSTEQKNRLCVEDNAARVVKEIYRLYREGYGYGYIARLLDSRGYLPPGGGRDGCSMQVGRWNPVAVQRILSNRVYIGDTVQGISEKVCFKSKKTRRLPPDRWVITRSTHEAIIGEEEFNEVQRLKSNKNPDKGPHKGELHLLKGIAYCGRCGSTMAARARKDRPMSYICGNYNKNGRIACTSHHINERVIGNILIDELITLLNDIEIKARVKELLDNELSHIDDGRNETARLERQLPARQRQQDILYLDKLEGRISEQLFIRTNTNIESRITALRNEIERLKNGKKETLTGEEIITGLLNSLKKENGISHAMVKLMVDKIVIFEAGDETNGAIAIEFKFG